MFDSAQTAEKICELLQQALGAVDITIEDQSHRHAGHKSAGGGGHFYIEVRSPKFVGLTPLARQRLVFDAVKPLMDREVHALSMRCLAY